MGRPVSDSQPLRRSLQVALVAALVVVAAGMVFALSQHGKFKAETSLIVLPANTLDNTDQANYLETLSRGQITATMAEVAQSGRFETEAETAMGLSTTEAAGTTVTVTVVPSTSVLLITSEASSKAVAEGLADRTAALAATYLKSMIKPFTATQVRSATGTAYPAGTSTTIILAGVLAAALAVAVAAQQASYQVLQARRRTRRVPPVVRRPGYAGTAGVTRPGVAPVPTATPTFGAPATAPATPATAGTAAPVTGTPAAVGTSPVATSRNGSASGSSEWSSASGLGSSSADWRSPSDTSSSSAYTTTNGTNGTVEKSKDEDAAAEPAEDSTSAEPGVTNERVLFS